MIENPPEEVEMIWFHVPRGMLFFNDRRSLIEYLAERDRLIEPEAAQRILECWQLDGVYLPENFLEGVRSRGTVITAREMLLYLQIMKAFGYGDPYVL